jgi:hypothetical protein
LHVGHVAPAINRLRFLLLIVLSWFFIVTLLYSLALLTVQKGLKKSDEKPISICKA